MNGNGNGPPFDPYARPGDAPLPDLPRGQAPEGIRRHALDVESYRELVAKALRARLVRGVLIGAAYFAFLVEWERFPVETLIIAVPVWGGVLVASLLFARWRARRLEPTHLQGYELLVSPRVLRRTAHGARPAEILGPEVTSIVEIPEGLSFVSTRPAQRLFVSRAVEGYAEVRDHARAWRPIEVRTGPSAYLRRLSHRTGERPRDSIDGTALERDPTLHGELAAVRAIAMPVDARSMRTRSLRAVVVLWLLLIVIFVAIWQFLSPAAPRTPRHRGAAQSV